ncbi:hypothetical protein N7516_008084 [Penicillium verrucosum]|uniref:uncharacterized protein n=1 Tax=Penicillium verrucosum TaxID=60171 RepID=UPI0025453845|nr:uncharacterized protein N7516_008084 [Penicillium verrucosum]KAJ5926311.1 hypothetical protein N7516_008084 [Penicillium verrucosum]
MLMRDMYQTPAWVTPLIVTIGGLFGLGLIVGVVCWAIRYLAHEASLHDPQRALIDHFHKEVDDLERAAPANNTEASAPPGQGENPPSEDNKNGEGESKGKRPAQDDEGEENKEKARAPRLHIIVEEYSASASTAEALNANSDSLVQWVPVPRGYWLPPRGQ